MEKFKKDVKEFGFEPFEVLSESWGTYALKDGSYLKLKLAVIKISRHVDEAGNMGISVNSNKTIGIIPPKNLRGPPATKPYTPQELSSSIVEDDIDFSAVQEEWSKYKLEDGTIVSVKLIPIKVSRTGKFDQNGEPIYIVNDQLLVKASLPQELQKKGIKISGKVSGPTFIT